MPGQPLLVELDDELRHLVVANLGRNELALLALLPLDEEHELAERVRRGHDLLRLPALVEALDPLDARLEVDVGGRGSRGAGGTLARPGRLSGGLVGLELGDELGTVEVFFRFPSVVLTARDDKTSRYCIPLDYGYNTHKIELERTMVEFPCPPFL